MNDFTYEPRATRYQDVFCDRWPIQCLSLNGMVYVPCYDSRLLYALPGGGYILPYDLIGKGAVWVERMLWRRK